MTYLELKKLTAGYQLPIAGKNEHGENVIIQHMTDKWSYNGATWERKYFQLTTAQNNGWTRHNFIYEDGDSEEFYTK